MPELELLSTFPKPAHHPRHAHQEIADLLAAALRRLRARPPHCEFENSERVYLGFAGHQRVNTNPDHFSGVRE